MTHTVEPQSLTITSLGVDPLDSNSVLRTLQEGTVPLAVFGPTRPAAAVVAIRTLDRIERRIERRCGSWAAPDHLVQLRARAREYREAYSEYGDSLVGGV